MAVLASVKNVWVIPLIEDRVESSLILQIETEPLFCLKILDKEAGA